MTAAPAHPAPHRQAVAPRALWFGLFGAPAVWSLQLMVSFALVAHRCFPASTPSAVAGLGGVWMVALVVSLAALGLALVAGATAWRSWHATAAEHAGGHHHLLETGAGRTRFMAFAGVLLSALFLIGVLMAALPLFLVGRCG